MKNNKITQKELYLIELKNLNTILSQLDAIKDSNAFYFGGYDIVGSTNEIGLPLNIGKDIYYLTKQKILDRIIDVEHILQLLNKG